MTKTQFINQTLIPYLEGKKAFGYDFTEGCCTYLDSKTGNQCAMGQYMEKGPWLKEMATEAIDSILGEYSREEVFKKRYVNDLKKFTIRELEVMQLIHDNCATLIFDTFFLFAGLKELQKISGLKLKKLENKLKEYVELKSRSSQSA